MPHPNTPNNRNRWQKLVDAASRQSAGPHEDFLGGERHVDYRKYKIREVISGVFVGSTLGRILGFVLLVSGGVVGTHAIIQYRKKPQKTPEKLFYPLEHPLLPQKKLLEGRYDDPNAQDNTLKHSSGRTHGAPTDPQTNDPQKTPKPQGSNESGQSDEGNMKEFSNEFSRKLDAALKEDQKNISSVLKHFEEMSAKGEQKKAAGEHFRNFRLSSDIPGRDFVSFFQERGWFVSESQRNSIRILFLKLERVASQLFSQTPLYKRPALFQSFKEYLLNLSQLSGEDFSFIEKYRPRISDYISAFNTEMEKFVRGEENLVFEFLLHSNSLKSADYLNFLKNRIVSAIGSPSTSIKIKVKLWELFKKEANRVGVTSDEMKRIEKHIGGINLEIEGFKQQLSRLDSMIQTPRLSLRMKSYVSRWIDEAYRDFLTYRADFSPIDLQLCQDILTRCLHFQLQVLASQRPGIPEEHYHLRYQEILDRLDTMK